MKTCCTIEVETNIDERIERIFQQLNCRSIIKYEMLTINTVILLIKELIESRHLLQKKNIKVSSTDLQLEKDLRWLKAIMMNRNLEMVIR